MTMFTATNWMTIAAAFLAALALTPGVRALACRWGAVAKPRQDRWHRKPTAMLGGVAIFLAVAGVYTVALDHTLRATAVLAAGALVWAVGLADDLIGMRPYHKLIGQMLAAGGVTAFGLLLPWTPSPTLNVAITLFWLIGITNAVNLLDNMDGLAAGVSALAAGFLVYHCLGNGQPAAALFLAVLCASLLGFLVFNSNPASIFMGDCGSMFVGFLLACAPMLGAGDGRSRSLVSVLAVPLLIMLIPIFDTTLVTVLRKLAGRPVSMGGRDHASHRLVALGLSERRAVWLLYGLAGVAGGLALLVQDLQLGPSVALVASFTVILALLGVYLARVHVYEKSTDSQAGQPVVAFLVDLTYKRRIFEVLLDVVLIILSYYAAHYARYGPLRDEAVLHQVTTVLPLLVAVKLTVFLLVGVYRGLWKYVSIEDLALYAKAVAAASIMSVLVLLYAIRFEGLSRVVFVLDGLFLFVLVTGSRMTFRLLRNLLPATGSAGGRRVLIYGAGDAGALLLRELRHNRAFGRHPVGFLDDDPRKAGKVMNGLKVFGGNGSLAAIIAAQWAEEVVISSPLFTADRVREIRGECRKAGVGLQWLRLALEPIGPEDGEEMVLPAEPETAPSFADGGELACGLNLATE
jgi:UDP-GlcNAc:undecaprenyl-phosphate GlcNAc-1-phosphate transferase